MPKKKSYHHGDLKNALIKAGVEILAKDGVIVPAQGGIESGCESRRTIFAFCG